MLHPGALNRGRDGSVHLPEPPWCRGVDVTKTPCVVGALVALVAEIMLFPSASAFAQEHAACATEEVPRASSVTPQLWRTEPAGPTGVTVYLDGDGGEIAAGGD